MRSKKKVMVFGSFDVLHEGHRSLFRQAKMYGDLLFVVVAKNSTYERLRGYMPVHGEHERLRVVRQEPLVEQALLGDAHDVYRVIGAVRPDIICLGYDQEAFVDKLEESLKKYGLNATIVRLEAHYPEKYKSSLMKKGDGYLLDL
jgi:FAD synthetase